MKRTPERLTEREFDVLVVGGGIHGVLAAWDASLRGMSVALIEKGDFGAVTSQNSLRIIHGGLRYLQDGNPKRVRVMARERTTWMKMAPHLVHPLPCLMPSFKKFSRSRLALGIALGANDLLSFDRNRLDDPQKTIHAGKTISQREFAKLLPGYDASIVTGAALWNDGQIHNSERLILEFILSAEQNGAEVANYVEAVSFLREGNRVIGVRARDILGSEEFDIRSRVVINCTGAWINQLLSGINTQRAPRQEFALSVAIDLIVDQIWPRYAVGVPSHPDSKTRSQMLFFVPWRNKSLIGTWHIQWPNDPETFQITKMIIQDFIDEINSAHPKLNLSLNNVHHVHWGFLPVDPEDSRDEHVKLMRDSKVVDHLINYGLEGLISIIGVKYTTARASAEKAIDIALIKLRAGSKACRTETTPVYGGVIERFEDFLAMSIEEKGTILDRDIIEHLVYTYGSGYQRITEYIHEEPSMRERVDPNLPVILAEVVHAVREEMAQKLIDVVQRRTEAGATAVPPLAALTKCAAVMADEMGWDITRQEKEINEVLQAYPFKPAERMVA